jgi:hypothetical protein
MRGKFRLWFWRFDTVFQLRRGGTRLFHDEEKPVTDDEVFTSSDPNFWD